MKRGETTGVAILAAVCLLTRNQTMPACGTGVSGGMGKTDGISRLQNTVPLVGGRGGEAPIGVDLENLEINPEEGDSVLVPMEMKGTVAVSLIFVSLPADGSEFSVDPKTPFDPSVPATQILSPDIKIENRSIVPIKLKIARVNNIGDSDVKFSEKFFSEREQFFQLIDTITGASAPGTAILVLEMEDRRCQTSQEFERYAICLGKIGVYVAEIEAGGQTTLRLYGKVSVDFYGGYEFTVRPALKISTVQINKSADSYRE